MKSITAAAFAELDREACTILDLRDDPAGQKIAGAVCIPFAQIPMKISTLPKERPVYVLCQTGSISREVAEILTDRGYDAYNIEGGYAAYVVHQLTKG